MGQYVSFIFIFLFVFSVHAQNSCKELFKKSTSIKRPQEDKPKNVSKNQKVSDPLELSGNLTTSEMSVLVDKYSSLIENVAALRKQISLFQLFTGDSARQTQFERLLREKEFNFLISNLQNLETAIDKAQKVFINVEANYIRLKQIYKDEQEGKISSFNHEQISQFKKDYANSFGEYFYIRTTLEELANLNNKNNLSNHNTVEFTTDTSTETNISLSKENAHYLLNKLGIPTMIAKKDRVYFKRPSIDELSEFFKEHPELLILKIQNDLKVQKIRALKLMPMTLLQVENIQAYILKVVPRQFRPIIGSFFAMNYNYYVLKTYLPNIMIVLDTPNEAPYQRLTALQTKSAEKNTLEFLTTFARITLYTKSWVELKGDAEKLSKDSPIYLKFYHQMVEAENAAVKSTSWLNPFYKPALVDYIRVWAGSLTFWVLVYFFFADDEDALKLLEGSGESSTLKPTAPGSGDIKWPEELSEVKRALIWMLRIREWAYSVPKP